MPNSREIKDVLDEVKALPGDWHRSGSLHPSVLEKIAEIGQSIGIKHSVETGTGKSTLLLSHLSESHTVFTQDDSGTGDSLHATRNSTLLRQDRVSFIVGPTQKTLPKWEFQDSLQLVLIDGPHGYPFPELEYFCLYPWLETEGSLIIDDINIPTVFHLYQVLLADEMYRLEALVHTTAFLRRTKAPVFDRYGDGWWNQGYNKSRLPMVIPEMGLGIIDRLKLYMPVHMKRSIKRILRMP
jgi:hypothetical protein